MVTFGEIMLRLTPPGFLRFSQAESFGAVYGGSEANVAVSLANFGLDVDYITRLPGNDIGDACANFIRRHGVGISKIIKGGDRLGIYFLETGAAQRGSRVIYDRANSAVATIEPGMVDWRSAFADASWFHWSGITPALSKGAADVCLEAVRIAKEIGLKVSCDINYRAALWKWGKGISEVMPELLEHCDVILGLGGPEAEMILGMPSGDFSKDFAGAFGSLCDNLSKRLMNTATYALTFRASHSASHNGLAGAIWHAGEVHCSQPHDISMIVDRIGGGDAFAAGIIYGIGAFRSNWQKTVEFAAAASCLKHSIVGDFNIVTVDEVEKLIGGDSSGRVSR